VRSEERGRLPKAVIPTDLYGQCCNLSKILEICNKYGVPVICDSAEAMGARYCTRGKYEDDNDQRSEVGDQDAHRASYLATPWQGEWFHAGYGAKAAVFSFNGNKIMTTSGGGMLASDDEDFIKRARFLSQQARDPAAHYEHTEIGYNYRMSNILAAIGRGQLRCLNDRIKKKWEIFSFYKKALTDVPGIKFMPEAIYGRSNKWLTVIMISPEEFGADREAVRLALESERIESRPVWKPMHMQPVFWDVNGKRRTKNKKRHYPCRVVRGNVAEEFFEKGLCLPSGTAMKIDDLDRIVNIINKTGRHGVNRNKKHFVPKTA
jgi:dTDP-4-amino-4,6-dideoxygalactose transaminase